MKRKKLTPFERSLKQYAIFNERVALKLKKAGLIEDVEDYKVSFVNDCYKVNLSVADTVLAYEKYLRAQNPLA